MGNRIPKAPWEAICWTSHSPTTVVVKDGATISGQHVIAECDTGEHARLIAAAPDLLEALRITRGNVASLGPAGALEPYAPYRVWLAMIDDAIAKATGEDSAC